MSDKQFEDYMAMVMNTIYRKQEIYYITLINLLRIPDVNV